MSKTLKCNMKNAMKFIIRNNINTIRFRKQNSKHSVKLIRLKKLDSSEVIFVKQISDGSIINLFDRTPFPTKNYNVVCPHFLELKWANGCWYDCAWCYLNGTFRFRPNGKYPHLKNHEKIVRHLEDFFDQVHIPYLLNSGELSDSLVYEGTSFSLSKDIIPLFKRQKVHKLLILTKSNNIKGLLESSSQDSVIISFSLNAFPVSERWEHKAPHPSSRIQAATELHKAGYKIRIRIDPMVPIENWKASYIDLIDKIFSKFKPERITLGSLRGLQSTINNSKDITWTKYFEKGRGTNWGKKIADSIRFDMYSTLIDYLRNNYTYSDIAMCKETISIWNKLGINYKKIKCNCIL